MEDTRAIDDGFRPQPIPVTPSRYVRPMTVTTRWAGVGHQAFTALADVVAQRQAADRLQPVTVVAPSATAALSLRRSLARRGGVAAVTLTSIEALAEQVAAPIIAAEAIDVGVDRPLVIAAVRAELAARPGAFGAIRHHRATWETIARAVAEVAAVEPAARAVVAGRGGLGADVIRVHDAVVARVGVGGRVAVLDAATRHLVARPGAAAALGSVVVFLPDGLDTPARRFLVELARTVEVTLVGGLVNDPTVDACSISLIESLGGSAPDDVPGAEVPARRVISTNDIDDEIGAAVRLVLARASGPEEIPMHRMAIVHPSGSPYTRAVAETLRAADVPFAGPSTETLAHSAAGRFLLSLFDIRAQDFARESLVRLWASGVIVDDNGAAVPAVMFDELSRRIGVVGGRASWRTRLEARIDYVERIRQLPPGDRRSPRGMEIEPERELTLLAELDRALTSVEEWIDSIPTAWDAVAAWVDQTLDEGCGPPVERPSWPTWEISADESIRRVVAPLARLTAVDAAPTVDRVVDTVRAALDAPAPRRSKSGIGLTVTTLDNPPMSPCDLVVIVGMAEGHIPQLGRDDVLLDDATRIEMGLSLGGDQSIRQQRSLATAIGCATDEAVLLFARCDQRSGRTQVPSRWLVDALESATGSRPRSEALMHGWQTPGVTVVPSHAAAVAQTAAGATVALHRDEYVRAALAAAVDFDAHPAVRDDLIGAGATLLRHRKANAFTRFDGNLDGAGYDVLADGHLLSPTSLERYAACPRRWYFEHALGVQVTDRPEAVDRMQARDKGTLTHLILEEFLGEALASGSVPAPGEAWSAIDRARMTEVAERNYAEFERRQLTGHPKWWALDQAEIHNVLQTTLHHDDVFRAQHDVSPIAVELTFGRNGAAPLEVRLDDGRIVSLAGQADRVDAGADLVFVIDYKYASATPYSSLKKSMDAGGDPLAGGTRLQLVAYAEASGAAQAGKRARATYWFLRPGFTGDTVGFEVTEDHRALFRRTLGVLVDGIAEGRFPAHSGPQDWYMGTNENCGYCDFNAICPDDREDEWERVRMHPSLRDAVTLAERGAPALLELEPEGADQ